MRVTCPKDKSHEGFIATAHVTEEWLMDSNGDFLEVYSSDDTEVVHRPDNEDVWYCQECGADAEVEDD